MVCQIFAFIDSSYVIKFEKNFNSQTIFAHHVDAELLDPLTTWLSPCLLMGGHIHASASANYTVLEVHHRQKALTM